MTNQAQDNTSNVKPPVWYITERDIDLLLIEEFFTSPEFQAWFVETIAPQVGLDKTKLGQLQTVHHSVLGHNGESDIEVVYTFGANEKWYFLLENKIGAEFQPQQAERYIERGNSYINRGLGKGYTTVLVAPKGYTINETELKGFQARFAYEQVIEWYQSQSQLGKRADYKISLFKQALDKTVRKNVDEQITKFFQDYWELADKYFPELKLEKPGPRASAVSAWIKFPLPKTGEDIMLYHDLTAAHAALQFGKMKGRTNELKQRYGVALTKNMEVKDTKGGQAALIRVEVPEVDVYGSFSEQEALIFRGLTAVLQLLRVFEKGMK